MAKQIRQLTLNGRLVKTFDSLKQASKELKICNTLISACCNFRADTAGGFRFEFENDV